MSARNEILARVRSATSDVTTKPRPQPDFVPDRDPLAGARTSQSGTKSGVGAETLELFAENVADYRASVVRVPEEEVGCAVVEALRAIDRRSVVVPTGLDPRWVLALGEAFDVVAESEAASPQTLDVIDAVVTGAAIGVAATGTIVLDHGPDQGRRALTLVPDTHVCVIRDDQVVPDVPEAVARVRSGSGKQPPLTWISGPSATSDIELQRVEGVHGPRTLIVVIAGTVPDGSSSPSSSRKVSP